MIKNILVVGSGEVASSLRGTLFGRPGYAIRQIAEAGELMTRIEEDDPLLVILASPAEEALRGCRLVKGDPLFAATPVVTVGVAEEAALQAGADASAAAPVTAAALEKIARRLLGVRARRSPRSAVDLPVLYRKAGGDLHSGHIRTLSLDGVFLLGEHLYPEGTELHLEIRRASPEPPLEAFGTVVWVNHPEWLKTQSLPGGMGVAFTRGEGVRQWIAGVLERKAGVRIQESEFS